MWEGTVVSIHIAKTAAGPMESVREIQALSGRGLEGDRYFRQQGTFSKKGEPDREITLIEIEAIEAMQGEKGIKLDPGASRRNIVTRGVPLNHLVGLEFSAGEVKLRGLRLCEPCSHLAKLTHTQVLPGLVHRGGLRAQILTDGKIRVADPVQGS